MGLKWKRARPSKLQNSLDIFLNFISSFILIDIIFEIIPHHVFQNNSGYSQTILYTCDCLLYIKDSHLASKQCRELSLTDFVYYSGNLPIPEYLYMNIEPLK